MAESRTTQNKILSLGQSKMAASAISVKGGLGVLGLRDGQTNGNISSTIDTLLQNKRRIMRAKYTLQETGNLIAFLP